MTEIRLSVRRPMLSIEGRAVGVARRANLDQITVARLCSVRYAFKCCAEIYRHHYVRVWEPNTWCRLAVQSPANARLYVVLKLAIIRIFSNLSMPEDSAAGAPQRMASEEDTATNYTNHLVAYMYPRQRPPATHLALIMPLGDPQALPVTIWANRITGSDVLHAQTSKARPCTDRN
ncbi:uncharacterized protein LAESUDRAFT_415030 [Laetiporus sulphureus 93-53]|uniref:Uncharacterized protein n=1 Tax=Laetiporus sulphureus 93-53 TaxID=1314785 RepID=A0A165C8H3_9APHY|nr:uncharacterized protein LAESUDRAFT_415030 [Laetiporus sulphureus 93-53]KZT02384.1 hypothetical protein LAESUDRAFT_415030 [Laetiporus sulphureus 93-53]